MYEKQSKEVREEEFEDLQRRIRIHEQKAEGLSVRLRDGIGKIPGGGYSERKLFVEAFEHKRSALRMSAFKRNTHPI